MSIVVIFTTQNRRNTKQEEEEEEEEEGREEEGSWGLIFCQVQELLNDFGLSCRRRLEGFRLLLV